MNCPHCIPHRGWFGTYEELPQVDGSSTVIWHGRLDWTEHEHVLSAVFRRLPDKTVRVYSHPEGRWIGGQVME